MAMQGHLHATIDADVLEAARRKRETTGQSISHVVEMALRHWIGEVPGEPAELEEITERHSRILLVDDDPLFRKVIQMVLSSAGYEVTIATGGDQALALMREVRPDLVVLDIMMEGILDGIHVSRVMWEDKELRKVPVVMMSSIIHTQHKSLFPQDEYLNAVDFLFKPFQPRDLLASIERILK